MDLLEKNININLKTFLSILGVAATIIGGWYGIQYKLEEAKVLPRPGTGTYTIDRGDNNAFQTWPPDRIEFTYKYDHLLLEITDLKKRVEDLENEKNNN